MKLEKLLDELESNHKEVVSGVFAGTICGPVLFNIFVNSLFECLNEYSVTEYVDDFAIVPNAKDSKILLANDRKAIKRLSSWCANNGLKLNVDKTKFILLNKLHNRIGILFQIFRNTDNRKVRLQFAQI